MDEDGCYAKLVAVLHPHGLACPRCRSADQLKVHRRHREPVLDFRFDACGRVFNAFTGTEFHKTHRRPSEILLILRGIAQGPPHRGCRASGNFEKTWQSVLLAPRPPS